ncbi:MAG: Tad domain-containing protein [Candidatus Omnitrophica bacterium]|nr:Tad domain-containing protein [Candidatus Omnitrophota bacterium]
MFFSLIYKKKAQVAPLMIAIIVILIMAIMVTVNIGKISLTKTRTSNAADAGALAGSIMHSNVLNTLIDTNSAMIAEYLSIQVTFLIPDTVCNDWRKYVAYLAFVAAQTAQYVSASQAGNEGYEEARNAAKQLAFMNAGIDEAKPRQEGESYEAWLKRDSKFQQWMESDGYESGDYSWKDRQDKENSFKVEVNAPDSPGLIPMPMVLAGLYWDTIGVCGKWCLPCITDLAKYYGCLAKAQKPGTITMETYGCCSCIIITIIGYIVPIAWIAGVTNDNPEISVTTTRIEPERDLGLWQMKYDQPTKPGEGISSQAKAKSSGGMVGPAPVGEYDSYLISGGY